MAATTANVKLPQWRRVATTTIVLSGGDTTFNWTPGGLVDFCWAMERGSSAATVAYTLDWTTTAGVVAGAVFTANATIDLVAILA